MAYLPFYITPEELALKQKKQEQQFYEGDNVHTWKKYDVEESFRYKFLCLSIAPVIPFLIFTFLLVFGMVAGSNTSLQFAWYYSYFQLVM